MRSLLDSPIFKVFAVVAVLCAFAVIGFANLDLEKAVVSTILITGYYIIFIPLLKSDGSIGGAIAVYFGILVAIYLIAIIVTAIHKKISSKPRFWIQLLLCLSATAIFSFFIPLFELQCVFFVLLYIFSFMFKTSEPYSSLAWYSISRPFILGAVLLALSMLSDIFVALSRGGLL